METKTSKEISKEPGIRSTLLGRPMSLLDEMERMFEPFQQRRSWLRPFHHEWPEFTPSIEQRVPSIDVIDYDDYIMVRAELPGVEKKDITISMTDKSVTLNATSCHEEKEEKADYYYREISSGSFTRTMGLPCLVDDSKAKAEFHNGVLELSIPKTEKSTRHTVKID